MTKAGLTTKVTEISGVSGKDTEEVIYNLTKTFVEELVKGGKIDKGFKVPTKLEKGIKS